MTAPIVWPDDRTPLAAWDVDVIGRVHADADRAGLASRPAGQLWERLAEYAEKHS